MAELDGFDSMRVGILDDQEKIKTGSDGLSDSGVYDVNAASANGVLSASVSGLQPSLTRINGSDKNIDLSGAGTGEVQCTVGINDLEPSVTYKLIGYKKADDGSYEVDPQTKPPYAVIELVSHDSSGDAVHMGLLKGKFSLQDKSLSSNSGNGSVNRATDSLQFTAVSRLKDDKVYKVGFEHDTSFSLDKFHSDLFPGSTANGVQSAAPQTDNH